MELRDDSRVELLKVIWRKDNRFYTVWTEDKSNFIELSEDSFNALMLLQQGKSLQEVSNLLTEQCGESYDVRAFVSELIQLRFVSSIDGISLPIVTPRGRTFPFLKSQHVRWIYSTPLLLCYFSVILSGVVILCSDSKYVPTYSDYFFHENYLLVLVLSIFTVLGVMSLHEFAHLIAGKSVGVQGYFSVGMRLFYPVVETNLTQLWSVPRRKRYLPFFAGMLNDGLIVSILIIFLWLADHRMILIGDSIYLFSKCVVLLVSWGILWQFFFFIRTDIYYVVSTILGCRNLYGDSWTYLFNKLLALFSRAEKSLDIASREAKIVRAYAPLMFIATIFSISLFALFGLPIMIHIFFQTVHSLLYANSLPTFIESFLLTCLVSMQVIGFIIFIFQSLVQLKTRMKQA